jgi:hypothetical protein
MNYYACSFHGLHLAMSGEDRILQALRARLGGFPEQPAPVGRAVPASRKRVERTECKERGAFEALPGSHAPRATLYAPQAGGSPGRLALPPEIHFEFVNARDTKSPVTRPPGPGRRILDPGYGEVLYFDEAQQLYHEVPGRARALTDLAQGRVRVAHGDLDARGTWLLSHLFFTVQLAELLKRQGLYMVHAAGLALRGRGLLVAGDSGSGKTTLALALLRAGFEFLGDDTVFLGANSRVLAFPDEFDITAQTARFFPELEALAREPAPGERPKRPLSATQVYGVVPCWECAPAVLVFPQRSNSRESALRPLPKDEVLVALACNVMRTELRSSQAHLDALAALAARCRCYRLEAAQDFDRVAALLRAVLETEAL